MTVPSDLAGAAWLTTGPVARVLTLLDRDGEQARVVGGAVRNALLGAALHEFDIATTALPPEVERRAAAAGLKSVPTGIDHGTVTVIVDGHPLEVTTLREDVETFGRRAKVAFGRDWKADAQRRDFTMNALSVARDGRLHDYVGGLADLHARHVRFIGDPAQRIAEDYLRILRFFRFHAAYGEGAINAAGLHACIVARDGLRTLSRERVRSELMKLLAAPRAAETLELMGDTGLLIDVLGGVPLVAAFAAVAGYEQQVGVPPDPVRGLGVLAVHVDDDAERLTRRLRLSNNERDRLLAMATQWWRITAEMDEQLAKALLYRLKRDRYVDRVLLAWSRASNDAANVRWPALASLPQRWAVPAYPIQATDFIARGIAKGPALGRMLRAAEERWIAAGFPSSRDAVERLIEGVLG